MRTPTGRFRFAPEQPPAAEDFREQREWLQRQFAALANAVDQANDLDGEAEAPTFPGFVPQVGMMRYLDDTELGYGPGPYCYVCRPTGLAPPDDTICYWAPMFSPNLNESFNDMPAPVELTLADTWYDLYPGGVDIAIRFGRRASINAIFNALSIGARQNTAVEYRVLVDDTDPANTFYPFWLIDTGTGGSIDFGSTTPIIGTGDQQVSVLSQTFNVKVQARSAQALAVTVEGGFMELIER